MSDNSEITNGKGTLVSSAPVSIGEQISVAGRRDFFHKLVAAVAVSGISGLLLGRSLQPVSAANPDVTSAGASSPYGQVPYFDAGNDIAAASALSWNDSSHTLTIGTGLIYSTVSDGEIISAGNVYATGSGILYTPNSVGVGTTSPSFSLDIENSGTGGRLAAMMYKNLGTGNVTEIGIGKAYSAYQSLGLGYYYSSTSSNSFAYLGNIGDNIYGQGQGLIVRAGGNVGIGTITPAYPLDIASSSLVPFRVSASTAWAGFLMVGGTSASGMNGMEIQNSTGQQFNLGIGGHTNSAVPDTFFIYDNNSSRFALTVTSADHVGIGTQTPTHLIQLGGGAYCDGSGAWIAGSSVRWKENITPLTDGVETLKQLHPVSYNRKETPGKTTMGFIAEEVGKVLPTVVDWDPKEAGYAEGYDHLAILALAVEAVKEQQRTIEQQQRIIERHEADNNSLRERIEKQQQGFEDQQQRIEVLERKLAAS